MLNRFNLRFSCNKSPLVIDRHQCLLLDSEGLPFSGHVDSSDCSGCGISKHPSNSHCENPLWACPNAVSREAAELTGINEASSGWVGGSLSLCQPSTLTMLLQLERRLVWTHSVGMKIQ